MAADHQGKKTKGRQKIEMKKIENEDDRLITFSKRRSGIYKKASELITLTGAELAFVVFSPAGKPFSFAHPSVDAVADKFLGKEPEANAESTTHPLVEAHRQIRIEELNQQHNELIRQLDAVKEKGKQLKQRLRGIERKGWWDTPIEELNVQEMIQMEAACEDIQMNLINKLKDKTSSGASSSAAAAAAAHHQAQMINPFAPMNPNEAKPPVFPPGYD
ncbi:hypothetical protein P3X46_026670 [Hevea brasiliensis]|uniref:MADS-box domain-containing protein n=1 Tax=Hevea brasiliensis TaxID=3981 RepID=A0ABQ9L0L3_HEVBR|nr:agamous-like MADS-box protein AGL62 [Hevea brasiliensis]KAJ9153205.1 hypothetical protein P3X46_026670 [Hevea brasiliensis]